MFGHSWSIAASKEIHMTLEKGFQPQVLLVIFSEQCKRYEEHFAFRILFCRCRDWRWGHVCPIPILLPSFPTRSWGKTLSGDTDSCSLIHLLQHYLHLQLRRPSFLFSATFCSASSYLEQHSPQIRPRHAMYCRHEHLLCREKTSSYTKISLW